MTALFEVSLAVVRHAAFTGELHARILNHHIITIRRDDVLTWLAERDVRIPDRRAEPLN